MSQVYAFLYSRRELYEAQFSRLRSLNPNCCFCLASSRRFFHRFITSSLGADPPLGLAIRLYHDARLNVEDRSP
jgi:hypothetical protein